MSGDDGGTYAPKSPDLSSFYSGDPTCQSQSGPSQPQQLQGPLSQPSQSQFTPPHLHVQQPLSTTFFQGPPVNHHHPYAQQPHQLATSPHALTQSTPANTPTVGYSPHSLSQQYLNYSAREPPAQSPAQTHSASAPGYTVQAQAPQQLHQQQQQQQQIQPQFYQSYLGAQYQQQFSQFPIQAKVAQAQFYSHPAPAPQGAQQQQQQQQHGQHQQVKSESQSPSGTMPPKRAAAQAAQAAAVEPSPVKTKFPTARIKRIMQADEEVGKVAQQTPIAVGKALEMFMVALVTKSADVAREKNSKRVSAQMLKQVVETDEQWDFLRDIVSRVENEEKAAKSGGRAKAESESEEEVPETKKVTRAGRKKKT
ncbi:hypothetical protein B0H63DRAFT_72994 [Podospora didyma]|uniref:NCT transcriptional regulatory complex subunit A n=1 Tax=Podospora didyma TaxID=330526 RepID=A0AAE0K2H9_9PEZI|nr:hypothetical protein B0H63DRAFT_72994 [Podospora didyma]